MREGFIYFCKNNGVEEAFQQYDNGVSAIEKEFEVSADLEFAKDKCRSLLERVKQSVKSSKDSGDSIGNRKNYLTYLNKYIEYKSSLSNADLSSSYEYLDACPGGENLIVYGTPGCGKSYFVDHTKLGKNSNGEYVGDYNKDGIFRTTFYLDYSNTDFVGQIVPVIEYEEDGRSKIDYRFVPGPFTNALEYAIANPKKKTALVIEELNRGNAPSIFGDLFQLLDRIDVEGKGYPVGTSEYGIINTSILNYLKDKDHYDKKYQYLFELDEIRIPANLNIYATMNTSDQNVFTLDTAFKRRWDFLKLKNEFINHGYRKYIVPGMDGITWESFVTDINRFIEEDNDLLTSEDKQIGVFFVSKKMLINPSEEYDDRTQGDITEKFAFKVFEYLWDDVAKFSRDKWFGEIKSLDKLIDSYISNGEQVFKNGLFKQSNHS